MKNREINRQLQSLDALVKKTRRACGNDLEMQAHWARYFCVLSAGLIENALAEIYQDFVRGAASQPVANFTNSSLSKIQNPKTSRFVEIARAFNPVWAADLESYVNNDGRKDAIDSIMANRHLIAHGKHSGITITRVTEYLRKATEVLEFIEEQCEK
jgi:hypothetical protein